MTIHGSITLTLDRGGELLNSRLPVNRIYMADGKIFFQSQYTFDEDVVLPGGMTEIMLWGRDDTLIAEIPTVFNHRDIASGGTLTLIIPLAMVDVWPSPQTGHPW